MCVALEDPDFRGSGTPAGAELLRCWARAGRAGKCVLGHKQHHYSLHGLKTRDPQLLAKGPFVRCLSGSQAANPSENGTAGPLPPPVSIPWKTPAKPRPGCAGEEDLSKHPRGKACLLNCPVPWKSCLGRSGAALARQSLPGTVSFPAGEGGRALPGGLQRSSATSGRAVRTLFTRWRKVMPVFVHPAARQ